MPAEPSKPATATDHESGGPGEGDAPAHGSGGDCAGCGGKCVGTTPGECRGPSPVPWLPFDRCMMFYESRVFPSENVKLRLELRVSYEHCLRLVGRQQGALLYTVSLLPGEEVRLFTNDRYRRVRSETDRMSVQTSFRQTMSALSESRRATSVDTYVNALTDIRASADTSVSAGGGLAGFLGAPTVRGDFSTSAETTVASGASVHTAAEQFTENAVSASQSVDAERSVVISTFEDAEHQETTVRTLKNDNHCHAVTYFVRRVNEVYESHTRVSALEWRMGTGAWRSVDDVAGVSDQIRKLLAELRKGAPKVGDKAGDERSISLPTDGTLYEAELAHCSSCEPVREAEVLVELEKLRIAVRRQCLEAELLNSELERRRALAAAGKAVELDLGTWHIERQELPAAAADGDDAC